MASRTIGQPVARVDGLEKVTGRTRFVGDLDAAGLLHCKAVVSRHPHAELVSIDTRAASALPGVVAILTARDIPGENQIGVQSLDQPLLVATRARQLSDRVALVAADTPEHAEAAVRAVEVVWRELPIVTDPVAALAPGAPQVHERGNLIIKKQVIHGDAEEALKTAALRREAEYRVGYQEHAYLETNGCLAIPEPDGGVTVHASAQAPFYVQKGVARVLGLPLARVRVVQAMTGGGFGGKEDYPSEPAACAALLAVKTGRPVRFVYSRAEDMAWSTKRHRMVVRTRLGADRDGRLVSGAAELFVDAGGYNGLSAIVSERANCTALGPYRFPAARVDTHVVYTNNLFGGAYRGFGTPQTTFAFEAEMDELAHALGISPAELRRRNLLRVGDETPTGQRLTESVPSLETFEKAVSHARYEERRREHEAFNRTARGVRRGIGIGCCLYGCGLHAGGQYLEGSAALLHVRPDGSVQLSIGGTEIGQGSFTVCAQFVAEELGIAVERVRVTPTSTEFLPDSGPTVASRTTIMSGNASLDAARQLRGRLLDFAAAALPAPRESLELRGGALLRDGVEVLEFEALVKQCFDRKVNLSAEGWYAPPRKSWDEKTGNGQAYSSYCFAAQIAEVEVDLRTGRTRVLHFTAAHDVGQVVNRALIEGQIQGGAVQGIGYALMEDLKLRDGRCLNPNFTDYLIPTTLDVPPIDVLLVEDPYSAGPFGAKGIGEPSLIPAAAAVANAVADATGIRFDELPLTPERVLLRLADARRPAAG